MSEQIKELIIDDALSTSRTCKHVLLAVTRVDAPHVLDVRSYRKSACYDVSPSNLVTMISTYIQKKNRNSSPDKPSIHNQIIYVQRNKFN